MTIPHPNYSLPPIGAKVRTVGNEEHARYGVVNGYGTMTVDNNASQKPWPVALVTFDNGGERITEAWWAGFLEVQP